MGSGGGPPQQAQALLRFRCPGHRETLYVVLDDATQANRGKALDAVAKMKAPTATAYLRGHPSVGAILVARDQVSPLGLRWDVKKTPCTIVGVPVHKPTVVAAQRILMQPGVGSTHGLNGWPAVH